jgi:DNA-binding PadR family transcriptional regulator
MKSRTRIPTDPEMVILALLLKRGGEDMYGRAMVLEDCRLKENWIYVVLARMTRYGYLIARLETAEEKQGRGGPRRRLYKVTAYGKRMFEARLQSDSTAAVQFSHSAALQHQARRARRNSRCHIQRDVVRPVSPRTTRNRRLSGLAHKHSKQPPAPPRSVEREHRRAKPHQATP